MAVNSLRGRYSHNIDVKGRMNFPTKLREKLGDCFIITKGNDGRLWVFSMEEWEKFEDKLNALRASSKEGRMAQRYYCSNAQEVEADKQGRILIPQFLREAAGITKDVVVLGTGLRAEIWDRERLEKLETESYTEENVEAMMETLDF